MPLSLENLAYSKRQEAHMGRAANRMLSEMAWRDAGPAARELAPPAMPVSGSIAVGRNVGVGVNSDRRKPSTPMTSHSGRIVAPHQLTRRASHSTRQSIGPAGCWAAPGATSTPGCGCKRASTATSSIGLQPPATMSRSCPNPIPIRWGMPARWCCIRTEPARAFTIPAPTAAPQGCEY